MRFLFDANLSRKLVERLAEIFPGSEHVSRLGLERAGDRAVFDFAADNGFLIASKDEDFHQLAFLYGPPPRIVWVRLGNCTSEQVERLLRDSTERLAEFDADPFGAFLILGERTA